MSDVNKREKYNEVFRALIVKDSSSPILIREFSDSAIFFDALSIEKLPSIIRWLSKSVPEIRASAVLDFVEQNLISRPIVEIYDLPTNCQIFTDSDSSRLFQDGGGAWREFYSLYPDSDGLFEISATGISSDGKQAIAYVGQTAGGLHGIGNIVVIENNGDAWKWIGEQNVWMS